MHKQTISFRLDSDKLQELDTLAKAMERDRTFVLNEAIRSYLDIQRWHLEHIRAGIHAADAGDLVDHTEVKKSAKTWRRH